MMVHLENAPLANRAVVATRRLPILATRTIRGGGCWIRIGAKMDPIERNGAGIVEKDHEVGPS